MPLQWSIGYLNATPHSTFTLANSPDSTPRRITPRGGCACGQWSVRAFPAERWKHLGRLLALVLILVASLTHYHMLPFPFPFPFPARHIPAAALGPCRNTALFGKGPLMWHAEEVPASTLASFGILPKCDSIVLSGVKIMAYRMPDT